METTGVDKIQVDVDSVERVKIRYNGKSQQDHQTVAVDKDSNMNAVGRALTFWASGRKTQPSKTQTKRHGPLGIPRAGVEDADKSTFTESMNTDREGASHSIGK
jgi:hypothetical protein